MSDLVYALIAVVVYALTLVFLMGIWKFSCWASRWHHAWKERRTMGEYTTHVKYRGVPLGHREFHRPFTNLLKNAHERQEFHFLVNELRRKQNEARNNPDQSPEA